MDLKELGLEALRRFVSEAGLPDFRARQLAHWIYEKRVASVEDITEFSKALRASLGETSYVSNLGLIDRLVSHDGTEKYLFALEDGNSIESVAIPEGDRLTLCVSSQVGCAMGCRFCLTGRGGLKRNLKAHEIADQVIASGRLLAPARITNVVFMGMGEPLNNVREVSEALLRITELMRISKNRITVSTSGLADKIAAFSRMAPAVNLAVSLNATTDEVRDEIMPVNRRFPIKALLNACRAYPLPRRKRITFEYVLLDRVNDSRADARRLVSLLRGIPSKVNLIPLNEFDGCPYRRPSDERVEAFQALIIDGGVTAIIRDSKGQDILAACGQLRAGRPAPDG